MVIDTVRRTIGTHNLIEAGAHIVIGLSGGPDSVCLFSILHRLSAEFSLTLHPVHVNHMLRKDEALRDQKFSEELAESFGWKCESRVFDCRAMAKEQAMSCEEAGRRARYDAFVSAAAAVSRDLSVPKSLMRIAVAHNANDQAETVLFRIIRGTGTEGLAGIPYRRMEQGFEVIRPLLDVSRDEIMAYCEKQNLSPVMDSTNEEALYARNRIRLELLPLLQSEYSPNIAGALTRLGRIAALDKDYFELAAEKELKRLGLKRGACDGADEAGEIKMDREGLASLHPALRHRVVRRAFRKVGLLSDISEERLAASDSIIEKKQGPKAVEFPGGYILIVEKGIVRTARSV